jgi:hypothetical protein
MTFKTLGEPADAGGPEALARKAAREAAQSVRYGLTKPSGTYRWFQSPNVIAIEHHRRPADGSTQGMNREASQSRMWNGHSDWLDQS